MEGILKNGSEFVEYCSFHHDGMTNILFSMDGVDLDIGRLAAWRLQTHQAYGGIWLSDYLPNKFGIELGALKQEPEPEKSAPPYTIKAYIENPNGPHDGGFSIPLPTSPEVIQVFLDNLKINNIHNVKISDVYSNHENDNNLSCWLNEALKAENRNHSLEELNYLVAKIADLDEERWDLFSAAIQGKICVDTIGDMINLTENLDKFDLSPAYSAEQYGEFLVAMHQDSLVGSFKKLENSPDEQDREFAQYVERLEKCVDHAAFGKMKAAEENGIFTDFGYLRRYEDFEKFKTAYRGVQDIPLEHRLTKPTLAETLRANAQKSREQFGEPTKSNDKGDIEL